MEVTFLRHGPLLSPYDNYEALTFEQLCQLAKQEIEPAIDTKRAVELVKGNRLVDGEYDLLFHSPSNRALATTQIITDHYMVKKVEKIEELAEILFDPAQLTTQEEFAQKGLPIIREKLFLALVEGNNMESIESCMQRIFQLEKTLMQSSSNRCLCVTHGFFMRLLELYFTQNKDYRKYSYRSLVEATNHSYLQGFVVTL